MTLNSDPSGTGLGGPGMWDPMPLTPPVKPPAAREEPQFIWSQPEPTTPVKEEPTAATAAPKKRKAKKKAAKKKAKKKAVRKKKTVKKKAKKKAAKRKKTVRRKKATKKKTTRKKKSSGRAKKRR